MNFFSRVTYNDRMSPLDFDIFRKVQTLMGVTPDFFEVVLMVSERGGARTPPLGCSFGFYLGAENRMKQNSGEMLKPRSTRTPRSTPIRSSTWSTACTTTT